MCLTIIYNKRRAALKILSSGNYDKAADAFKNLIDLIKEVSSSVHCLLGKDCTNQGYDINVAELYGLIREICLTLETIPRLLKPVESKVEIDNPQNKIQKTVNSNICNVIDKKSAVLYMQMCFMRARGFLKDPFLSLKEKHEFAYAWFFEGFKYKKYFKLTGQFSGFEEVYFKERQAIIEDLVCYFSLTAKEFIEKSQATKDPKTRQEFLDEALDQYGCILELNKVSLVNDTRLAANLGMACCYSYKEAWEELFERFQVCLTLVEEDKSEDSKERKSTDQGVFYPEFHLDLQSENLKQEIDFQGQFFYWPCMTLKIIAEIEESLDCFYEGASLVKNQKLWNLAEQYFCLAKKNPKSEDLLEYVQHKMQCMEEKLELLKEPLVTEALSLIAQVNFNLHCVNSKMTFSGRVKFCKEQENILKPIYKDPKLRKMLKEELEHTEKQFKKIEISNDYEVYSSSKMLFFELPEELRVFPTSSSATKIWDYHWSGKMKSEPAKPVLIENSGNASKHAKTCSYK